MKGRQHLLGSALAVLGMAGMLTAGFCGLQGKDWLCECQVRCVDTLQFVEVDTTVFDTEYITNQSKKDAEAICATYVDLIRRDPDYCDNQTNYHLNLVAQDVSCEASRLK